MTGRGDNNRSRRGRPGRPGRGLTRPYAGQSRHQALPGHFGDVGDDSFGERRSTGPPSLQAGSSAEHGLGVVDNYTSSSWGPSRSSLQPGAGAGAGAGAEYWPRNVDQFAPSSRPVAPGLGQRGENTSHGAGFSPGVSSRGLTPEPYTPPIVPPDPESPIDCLDCFTQSSSLGGTNSFTPLHFINYTAADFEDMAPRKKADDGESDYKPARSAPRKRATPSKASMASKVQTPAAPNAPEASASDAADGNSAAKKKTTAKRNTKVATKAQKLAASSQPSGDVEPQDTPTKATKTARAKKNAPAATSASSQQPTPESQGGQSNPASTSSNPFFQFGQVANDDSQTATPLTFDQPSTVAKAQTGRGRGRGAARARRATGGLRMPRILHARAATSRLQRVTGVASEDDEEDSDDDDDDDDDDSSVAAPDVTSHRAGSQVHTPADPMPRTQKRTRTPAQIIGGGSAMQPPPTPQPSGRTQTSRGQATFGPAINQAGSGQQQANFSAANNENSGSTRADGMPDDWPRNVWSGLGRVIEEGNWDESDRLYMNGIQAGIGYGITAYKECLVMEFINTGRLWGNNVIFTDGTQDRNLRAEIIRGTTAFEIFGALRGGEDFLNIRAQIQGHAEELAAIHSQDTQPQPGVAGRWDFIPASQQPTGFFPAAGQPSTQFTGNAAQPTYPGSHAFNFQSDPRTLSTSQDLSQVPGLSAALSQPARQQYLPPSGGVTNMEGLFQTPNTDANVLQAPTAFTTSFGPAVDNNDDAATAEQGAAVDNNGDAAVENGPMLGETENGRAVIQMPNNDHEQL
ncbi:hypothetical protein JX265_010724 [Neoarthrinium moseri]|uniref:Uncharacterized protein n=1 Tax=Neoarthrinium moseri TaxID=1658444 RepID=A0A9Q0ALB9_9PEZI|nr:hypothetical protein JX265_010724 [Neoarthrinium moseri]